MDYEKVLEDVGGLNRYQFIMFNFLAILCFKSSLDLELMVLQLYSPLFRCLAFQHTNGSSWNSSFQNNITTSISGNETFFNNVCVDHANNTCLSFEYDRSIMESTLVTEFNLVCEKSWWVPLMQNAFIFGNGFGMLFGVLSDRIGRRKMLILSCLFDVACTPLVTLMTSPLTQTLIRFFKGFSVGSYYQALLFLGEITTKSNRDLLGNLFWIYWCFGYMGAAGLGYFQPNWMKMQLFSTIICVFYLGVFIVMPESPRWLLLKGRNKEAFQIFKRMARINGRRLSNNYFQEDLPSIRLKKEPTGQICQALRYPVMRKKVIIIWFTLLFYSIIYYGLSLDATFVSDNIFLNIFLNGLIELPGIFGAWYASHRFGRRISIIISVCLAGICVIIVPFLPKGNYAWIRACVAMLGKLLVTSSYAIDDVFATELFPTSIRYSAFLIGSFMGTSSSIFSPYINYLTDVYFGLSGIVFGVMSFLVALLVFQLPETHGQPLAQNVIEAELLTKGKESQYIGLLAHKKLDTLEISLPLKNFANCNNVI